MARENLPGEDRAPLPTGAPSTSALNAGNCPRPGEIRGSVASALDDSPILHDSPGDLGSLGLVCTVVDPDVGKVERTGSSRTNEGFLPLPLLSGIAMARALTSVETCPCQGPVSIVKATLEVLGLWTPVNSEEAEHFELTDGH